MNPPRKKYGTGIILKYVSGISKMLGFKGSITLKSIRIYKYWITEIFEVLHSIHIQFDNIQVNQILLQIIPSIKK